jgi:energy-coupling factor transporter ATP-binding protein EcfA2
LSIYLYCGQTVVSNIAIPELSQSNNSKTGLLFSLESPKKRSTEPIWFHHWLSPSGEKLLSYCRQDSYHWLRFPGLADFRISANAKEVSCYPLPEVSQETIRHLFLDQVLPRCLAHQGKIMLHASAVRLEQGLILFLGDSGAGKSTLAGNFHQAGSPVISDDCVWIKENKEQIVAVPSYGGLRLWEDSLKALFAFEPNIHSVAHYSSKKRVVLDKNNLLKFRKGMPILAVIVLSSPGQISASEVILDRLSQREAFIVLMKQSFHLNVMDLKRIKCHMQALGRIVLRMPSFRLSMPRDYDLLPIARQKILEKIL